jgi:membrane-bound ClpP family serine protease
MLSIKISLIVFACVFGGALLGILLHAVLPQHHLSAESKDIVKLGMGLVGTMAALVLGLLVASAKSSYDTQSAEMTQLTAKVALLDRILAHYGPETQESRDVLRATVTRVVSHIWAEDGASAGSASPQSAAGELLYDKIHALSPKNNAQRSLQSQALSITMDIGELRQLMFAQATTAVSTPLLVVLVLWLTFIFICFGLFAPFNSTVVSSLFVSALSVSGAIFLILDMYTPYTGVIAISRTPLHIALAQLGQ